MSQKNSVENPQLEESMKRLTEIVKKLESSEVSLEESLKLFEEGVEISRRCHSKLTEVEKRIEILTKVQGDSVEMQPYKS